LGRAGAQDVASCVLTPDSGEGPFYFDPSLVRADITEGLPGAPLTIAVRVVRAEDCATLENARFDLWHADALGLYSGYERQSGVGGVSVRTVAAARHLRGTQFTDADGRVEFRTIYPSWYGGRTPHLHFKVFLGGAEIVSSQIFFDDAINDRVFHEWEPYRTHVAKRVTRNEADMFLADEVGGVFCEAEAAANGVTGTAVVAVARPRA
jgi:protocatechuate 3,4-dioxygenase beta subunit